MLLIRHKSKQAGLYTFFQAKFSFSLQGLCCFFGYCLTWLIAVLRKFDTNLSKFQLEQDDLRGLFQPEPFYDFITLTILISPQYYQIITRFGAKSLSNTMGCSRELFTFLCAYFQLLLNKTCQPKVGDCGLLHTSLPKNL